MVFDGVDINNKVRIYGNNAQTKSSNITFKNGHIWDITSGNFPSYPLIQISTADNFTIDHMEIGPFCCDGDGIYGGADAATVPSNFVLKDSYIHDLYDSCRYVPASFGTCSGSGFGDTVAGGCLSNCIGNPGFDHVDGIHFLGGGNGIQLLRNKWYAIGANGDLTGQTIFFEGGDFTAPSIGSCGAGPYNNVTFTNIEITNNLVYAGAATSNNTVSIGDHYCGNSGIDGYLKVFYNTFWGGNASAVTFAIAGLKSTLLVTIAGNLIRKIGGDCTYPDYPQTGSLTPTWRNNLNGGTLNCGTGGQTSITPTFVSSSDTSPDAHLFGTQTAIGAGEATYCPSNDIDLDARPRGSACDVGADEAG